MMSVPLVHTFSMGLACSVKRVVSSVMHSIVIVVVWVLYMMVSVCSCARWDIIPTMVFVVHVFTGALTVMMVIVAMFAK